TELVYTVNLSFPPTLPVTYDIATIGGNATAGTDYVAKSLTGLVIPVGQTSATFSVLVKGDTVPEGTEYVDVEIGSVTNASTGNGWNRGEIRDDDNSITVSDASVSEGNSGTRQMNFTVSLATPPVAPISFEISTSNGTASASSDFVGNW